MRNALKYVLIGALPLALLLCGSTFATAAEPAVFLIRKHAQWKYFAERAKPAEDWRQRSFDDAGWKSGAAGFGYGDADDQTILDDMQGQYTSVYIRASFEVENAADLKSLYLYLKFDDGFIAYLNGTQVAAASVTPTDSGLQVDLHEAETYEEFVIEDAARLLRPGRNVFAIEGHNAALDSSDFSLAPVLSTQKLDTAAGLIVADDYLQDLNEFEWRLLDQSSYLTRRGFDYESELKALRASISGDTRIADFVAELRKLVMQIGDCHASVSWNGWPESGKSLPLRPADTAAGVAALGVNRNEPLNPKCPYIETIDGVPLDRWMDAAAQYVPHGSSQFVRRGSLRWLGQMALIRHELGLPAGETVLIGLRSADGTMRAQKQLRLTGQEYAVAAVQLQQTRRLADNIGYIRIATMDQRLADSTVRDIKQFRDTDGLIIDVRDNGGGTYDVLRAIFGFFVPDGAKPYVTNIAAYRLSGQFSADHIAYRPTHCADWVGWSDEERAAIGQAAAAFKPEWRLPDGKFSDWHYMILSRQRSGRGAEDYSLYDKPVVVLCNAGSFSATDGFLSAFASLPQVTIIGEPSGGGSGATRRFQLPNTQVEVALSSMVSYRANGKLFDGSGVEVDVLAMPALEDFTMGTDSVLERGITRIREHRR